MWAYFSALSCQFYETSALLITLNLRAEVSSSCSLSPSSAANRKKFPVLLNADKGLSGNLQTGKYVFLTLSLSLSPHPPRLFSLVLFKNGHYQKLNSALPRVAAVLLTSAKFLNPRCEFGPLSLIKAPVCSQ